MRLRNREMRTGDDRLLAELPYSGEPFEFAPAERRLLLGGAPRWGDAWRVVTWADSEALLLRSDEGDTTRLAVGGIEGGPPRVIFP